MIYYRNFEENDTPSHDLFVHIGMPKSGSTFLQQYVFPSVSKRACLNINGEKQDSVRFVFDAFREQQEKERDENGVRILSNEALCGMWHHGIEFSGWECFKSLVSEGRKAEARAVFLFILRDLSSYSWAMYLDQLKKGKIKKGYGNFLSQFSYEDLSIERRLQEMQGLDLVVFFHKDLVEEQERSLSIVAKYLGVDRSEFGELKGVTSNLTPKKELSMLAHRIFCKTSVTVERVEKAINLASRRLLGRTLVREHYLATKNRRDTLIRKIDSSPFGNALRREKAPDEWEAFFLSDMEKSKFILKTNFESLQP